jgi:hypothetical protein
MGYKCDKEEKMNITKKRKGARKNEQLSQTSAMQDKLEL